jgi:hypothetical protein
LQEAEDGSDAGKKAKKEKPKKEKKETPKKEKKGGKKGADEGPEPEPALESLSADLAMLPQQALLESEPAESEPADGGKTGKKEKAKKEKPDKKEAPKKEKKEKKENKKGKKGNAAAEEPAAAAPEPGAQPEAAAAATQPAESVAAQPVQKKGAAPRREGAPRLGKRQPEPEPEPEPEFVRDEVVVPEDPIDALKMLRDAAQEGATRVVRRAAPATIAAQRQRPQHPPQYCTRDANGELCH